MVPTQIGSVATTTRGVKDNARGLLPIREVDERWVALAVTESSYRAGQPDREMTVTND